MNVDLPLGVSVDFSFWQLFLNAALPEQIKILFVLGGWLVFAYLFLKNAADFWVAFRQSTRGTKDWRWVVLAVDVPAMFIQTPKAVEQIFAHLSGALLHTTVESKFWLGKVQKGFSFEVISIEGYTQFLVRAEEEFRDLIEASIYAQYTEAEITEVEDYVNNIPDTYPNKEYDVMGVEFKLEKEDVYPLRTYPDFQYSLSKDAVFSDPMAAILENFSRIGHGENLWMQIVVEPAASGWKEKGIELAKKIMSGDDGHGHHGGGAMDLVTNIPKGAATLATQIIQWNFEGGHHEEEKKAKVDITPGTKKTIEAIEDKIAKIGFKSKVRVLYAARKEAFHPTKCVEGMIGAMSQFHEMNRNSLIPGVETHASYDSKHVKSNKMKTGFVSAFKKRKMKWGKIDGYILNIEELATIWHFPLPFVKTPLLSKAGAKRAEPPSGLPTDMIESPLKRKLAPSSPAPTIEPHHEAPPEDLPFG